jgi:hypothetical protein
MGSMRWLLAIMLAATPVAAQTIVVESDPCPYAVHVADPDVAYQPDVDVDGRPLVPVEVSQGRVLRVDPEDVAVVIEVPLREAQAAVNDGGKVSDFDATAEVGVVTLGGDDVLFNGEPFRAEDGCPATSPQ